MTAQSAAPAKQRRNGGVRSHSPNLRRRSRKRTPKTAAGAERNNGMKNESARGLVIAMAVVIMTAGIGAWGFKRIGSEKSAVLMQKQTMATQEIKLMSTAFPQNGKIPARFTCDGENLSPPLLIRGVPAGAKALALIMHDPDAPRAGGWTHWVKWNIPPSAVAIGEGEEPAGVSGRGTGGAFAYQGPCPPSGTHRYIFTVYALNAELSLSEGATKTELEAAMAGHTLGTGELIGHYAREQ
ncbi:MAG: PEBP family protein [Parcubacteria group bacterium Greene0416_79]|nr:MAG: PEBP family protein [Parcubacteria group bacterium Greene0416_79]